MFKETTSGVTLKTFALKICFYNCFRLSIPGTVVGGQLRIQIRNTTN